MADLDHAVAPPLTIREARADDWPQIWPIIHDVITEQRTFAYDPDMDEHEANGFVTLGIAPGAFRHPDLRDVGLRIMWLDLR